MQGFDSDNLEIKERIFVKNGLAFAFLSYMSYSS